MGEKFHPWEQGVKIFSRGKFLAIWYFISIICKPMRVIDALPSQSYDMLCIPETAWRVHDPSLPSMRVGSDWQWDPVIVKWARLLTWLYLYDGRLGHPSTIYDTAASLKLAVHHDLEHRATLVVSHSILSIVDFSKVNFMVCIYVYKQFLELNLLW